MSIPNLLIWYLLFILVRIAAHLNIPYLMVVPIGFSFYIIVMKNQYNIPRNGE